MAEETNVKGTETTATTQEPTFTQSDLDRMISARLERERKKYPSEEELTAYRNWLKDGKEASYAKAQTDLAAATREIEQLKRDKYVSSKGLSGEEAEFIAFKASKLVDNKTTFEQAVDKLTENRKKATFDWSAQVGGGSKEETVNAAMNNLIRGALK